MNIEVIYLVSKVLKTFQDPLSRQVSEGVYIRRNTNNSLNTKLDFLRIALYYIRNAMAKSILVEKWSHIFFSSAVARLK